MEIEFIRQQVKEATSEAVEAWRKGKRKLALWNCETGDRTHLE